MEESEIIEKIRTRTEFCNLVNNMIEDERKGIIEYSNLMGMVSRIPDSKLEEHDTFLIWALLQDIKADEEKHGISLERLKDKLCR